jgi:hypothetical protein
MNTRFQDPRHFRLRIPRSALRQRIESRRWGYRALAVVIIGALGVAVWVVGNAQPLGTLAEFRGSSSIVVAN